MILKCPACSAQYILPDHAIGVNGRKVRCKQCNESWFQHPVGYLGDDASDNDAMSDMSAPAQFPSDDLATEETFSAPDEFNHILSSDDTDDFSDVAHTPAKERSFEGNSVNPDLPATRHNKKPFWTLAFVAAFVISLVAIAITYWANPDWIESVIKNGPNKQPDLIIELAKPQDHRTLPDGTKYFAASGAIINPTDREQIVPAIAAELHDKSGQIVYRWIIKPPVRQLAPGERANFNEAKIDVPAAAKYLTVNWANTRQ